MDRKAGRRVVGLDCHPDTFTAAVLRGEGPRDACVEKVTDALPWNRLEDWLARHAADIDTVALEAGANSFAVHDRLAALGLHAVVLDSEAVARFGKELVDTDRTSAVRIARVLLSEMSDSVWVPDPETRERRKVHCCYRQARADRTRCINRIKSMLNEHLVRLPKGTRLRTAEGRRAVSAAHAWSDGERALLEESFLDLERADAKFRAMRRTMARTVLSDPAMLALVRIYGLRHITVYAIMAMIGTVKRFRSPKQMVAYLGVSPSHKTSGTSVRKGRIRRSGRPEVRALLVQAGQAVLQHQGKSNPLHSWAWKVAFRRSRGHAVIAAARKLVVAAWYVLNGKELPLSTAEETRTIRWKLEHLGKEVGAAFAHSRGFRTMRAFLEEKMTFFTEQLARAT